jgi:hypothetical protein
MTAFRFERSQVPPAALALLVCAVAGATVAVRAPAAPLIGIAVALALVSLDWRYGVTALLVVLPFSGVPVFMAGRAGLAVRDAAIVVPLYMAFALATTRWRDAVLPRMGIALPALTLFAIIVLAHVAVSPSLVVGAIGTKVWLAYIPMIAVGYHFVRSRADFERALRLTALLGLLPAAIAVAEWFIATRYPQTGVWTNNFGPFRHLYGSWYAEVSTSGVAWPVGGHTFIVPRVPSTFTSSTQYYLFGMVAFAGGLSQALRTGSPRWTLCAFALAMGVVASGQRQSYVAVPLMAVVSLLLARSGRNQIVVLALAGCGSLIVLTALGSAPMTLLSAIPGHAREQMATAWGEFQGSLSGGIVGHGTGWDTQAALRYGGSASTRYIENWYAKAVLELGFAGLAAIAVALASLQWRLLTALRGIDATSRRAAAPLCVLLLVMTATLFKGPVLDLDPLNVYFWLLIGMLLSYVRIGRLDGDASRVGAPAPQGAAPVEATA